MAWLIERTEQSGGYVTRPGSLHSYTQNPLQARRYMTEEEARSDMCDEGERLVTFEELLEEAQRR